MADAGEIEAKKAQEAADRKARDDNHPDNKKFSGEGWDDLSKKKRHCTDILCLLILIACWFTMTIIGLIALGAIKDDRLRAGDPNRLLHAIDYDGRICGVDSGVKSRPKAVYMTSSAVVCVHECPTRTDLNKFICFDERQDRADEDVEKAWEYVGKQECLFQTKSFERKIFLAACIYKYNI